MILLSKCVYTGVLIMFAPVSRSSLILMKREVLGHKFSKKEAQKVVCSPSAEWFLVLAPSVSKCPEFLCFNTVQQSEQCWMEQGAAPKLINKTMGSVKNWCFLTNEMVSKHRLHCQVLYQSKRKFHLCCFDMKSSSEDTYHLDF